MIGELTLTQLAQVLDGELLGDDVTFSNVSTDTRSLEKGDLYLALVGENFDGNDFVADAGMRGACGAVVSRAVDSELTALRVKDTHEALGALGHIARKRSEARVIALTGSQGKTTVKEMLHGILASAGECLATEANLNNTIGVPLTLLKIEARHRYVVVEMGANGAGEIAFSVAATEPDIALITNASPAHIEGFGSLQGIVTAKGEIIDGLKNDGVMVLNADDAHVQQWTTRAESKRVVKFSYENAAGDSQYFASSVETSGDATSRFILHTPQGDQALTLGFLGRHNIVNAIAASAVALEAGASLGDVAQGLASVGPVTGRLSRAAGINGCSLIDDSYNASPGSFFAAIDVLASLAGKTILVMGDMKELGEETDSAHRGVGEYAASSHIDEFWATGEKSRLAIEAYGKSGRYFDDQASLITALKDIASSDSTILVKGSRGAGMNNVVSALTLDGEIRC